MRVGSACIAACKKEKERKNGEKKNQANGEAHGPTQNVDHLTKNGLTNENSREKKKQH